MFKIIISSFTLDNKHWSTNWIPISYTSLTKNQYKKSTTFLYSENDEVNAICRAYFMTKKRVELGDVWLNEKLRGKRDKSGKKYSVIFMKKVISKIWKMYPSVTEISLIVSENNKPAIKLYEKLNFVKIKNISSKMLSIDKGIYMIRKKITRTT